MEPRFELRYIPQEKNMVEFYRKVIGPRPVLVIIGGIIFGWMFLQAVLGGYWQELLVYYIIFAAALGMLLLIPNIMARKSFKQALWQNDGKVPETVVTVGDSIEIQDGILHMHLEYRKITKVLRLKNAYALLIDKNGVILDINGFTKGSFAEFKQFLKEKRPDLTIPE